MPPLGWRRHQSGGNTARVYRLDVTRTQWASGHGFFHTGVVSGNGVDVRYAYDCGSLRGSSESLEREITVAASRLDMIDLFFLSHFDFDHVSGVQRIASLVAVGTFVIPLVSPEERFFRLAARSLDGDPEQIAPLSPDDSYWALLADPAAFLGQLSENVVTIAPGFPLDVGDYVDERNPTPKDVGSASSMPPHVGNAGAITSALCNGDEVWIWATFVTQAVTAYATYFAEQLQERGLIANVASLSQAAVLADLVLAKRRDLTSIYLETVRQVGKSHTLNLTSLMLYSGPRPSSGVRTYRRRDLNRERTEMGAWGPGPGWLGCGDANFRAKERRDEFNRVFASMKRQVGTFAPSHHGSPLDWDRSLLDGFGANGNTIPVCVFGADGAYQHPGHQVLLEIHASGGLTVIVSGDESSRWTERLTAYIVP